MLLDFQNDPSPWYPNEQTDRLEKELRFLEIGLELWYSTDVGRQRSEVRYLITRIQKSEDRIKIVETQ